MTTQLAVALAGGAGALAGALISSLIGLLAGWQGRRNDQRRWLLDKRLDVYTVFNEGVGEWQKGLIDTVGHSSDSRGLMETLRRLADLQRQMELLSPPDTSAKARDVTRACHDAVIFVQGGGVERDMEAIVRRRQDSDELLHLQKRDLQGGRSFRANRRDVAQDASP